MAALFKTVFFFLAFSSCTRLQAQEPRLMLPINHAGAPGGNCHDLSADGKLWATGYFDNTIKIWDVASGKLLRDIVSDTTINSVQFSKDRKHILAGQAGVARVWDVESGALLFVLDKYYGNVRATYSADGKKILTSDGVLWDAKTGKRLFNDQFKGEYHGAEISADAKKILAFTKQFPFSLSVYDAETGRRQSAIKVEGGVEFAHFSPDGQKVVAVESLDSNLRVWESGTGKLLYERPMAGVRLVGAAFSSNNRYLLINAYREGPDRTADGRRTYGRNDTPFISVYELNTYREVVTIDQARQYDDAFFTPDGNSLYVDLAGGEKVLYNLATRASRPLPAGLQKIGFYQLGENGVVVGAGESGTEVRELATGKLLSRMRAYDQWISSVRYSTDGKKYVTAADGHVKVWDAMNHQLLLHIPWFRAQDSGMATRTIQYAEFSPDGSALLGYDYDSVYVWNAATGARLNATRLPERGEAQFVVPSDSLVLLQTSDSAFLWNHASGKTLRLAGPRKGWSFLRQPVESYLQIAPDARTFVHLVPGARLAIRETATGAVLKELDAEATDSTVLRFNPTGSLLLVANGPYSRLFETKTGKPLWTADHKEKIDTLLFQNEYIVACSDSVVQVWDVASGRMIRQLPGYHQFLGASDDGSKLLTADDEETLSILELPGGKLLARFETGEEVVAAARFAPGGKQLLLTLSPGRSWTGSVDGRHSQLSLWDVATGNRLRTLSGVNAFSGTWQFSPDGRSLLTISRPRYGLGLYVHAGGNIIRQWNTQDATPLLSVYLLNNDEHLLVDSFNRYDGSEKARQLLYLVCGTEIISLDQVKEQLWVPNLGERLLRGETINAPRLADLQVCGITPLIERIGQGYRYQVRPRGGGLGETVAYVNDIEVKRFAPTELRKTASGYELQLPATLVEPYFMKGAENSVTVKAYTKGNAIASRGVGIKVGSSTQDIRPPSLYAVMVGVSDYKGLELDLKYAAKDAQDLSDALAVAARKLLNADGQEHVFVYNVNTGPARTLFPEKQSIRRVFAEIGQKAQPNDIVLVFFAGHGVMAGEKKQFYFLTADASAHADVQATGISISELSDWMKPASIKAQKRILIFDACNSGQAINDLVQIGRKEDRYIAARNDDETNRIKAVEKLNERSGLFILSAAASDQSAYELGRYAQGVLTYALLKAVKERPDILEDGKYLNVDQWFSVAERTVSEIVAETGNRQHPQKFGTGGFNIGIVDREVASRIVLPGAKPLFVPGNFQNSDEAIAYDDLGLAGLVNDRLGGAGKAATGKFTYVSSGSVADAYTISGRYQVAGDEVLLRVTVIRDRKPQFRFELKGNRNALDRLAADVVQTIEKGLP